MPRTASLVAAVLTSALAALVLAGCAGDPEAAPTTPAATVAPAPTPTKTATPTPTATPAPTSSIVPANIPASCDALGSGPERQEAVGDLTLQGDGTGFTRPSPAGAALALGCDWIVGDSTGMLVLLSTATQEAVTAAAAALPAEGWSCAVSDDCGADFCSLPGSGPDTEEMIVARDGVWVYMGTSNRNGRGYLSNIATQLWG